MKEEAGPRYDPLRIEDKWQKIWDDEGAFKADDGSPLPKYYLLEMFPYPSGKIHMGHVRNYSIGDVIARFLRMNNFNVLHPMGWDAFGLPAENAAIEHGLKPHIWTEENIKRMKREMKRLGFSYDWRRETATCDPEYYRWGQWIFLKMYELGLAYRKSSNVNWCPECATVLANEQAENGICWRCESSVESRGLDQWFFKISAYADQLLDGCDDLAGWPDRVLVMQKNWIGRSEGVEVDFPVYGLSESLTIFTTRPDTIYGATFVSLAAGHPLLDTLTRGRREKDQVRAFVERMETGSGGDTREEPLEKEGVFTGAYCINPLNGRRLPIYVANFVLVEYGTGAVMAVPAHDQRDFEFAKKYDIPLVSVISQGGSSLAESELDKAYTGDGTMINSGIFDGMYNRDAVKNIVEHIESKGYGRRHTNYRLRDWGISRQRYWGCPIPIIYCKECGTVPVPYEDLPVCLPYDIALTGKGGSPLGHSPSFVEVPCPVCGIDARRETDTMDTFVDSSWYFLRYLSPSEGNAPFKKEVADRWMPVDQYIGGIEHAVMHLLYARFFVMALHDLKLLDLGEPFKKLLTQGMVCKESLKCPEHGYIDLDDIPGDMNCFKCGCPLQKGPVEKMSKSKKNTIEPIGIIDKYGADTTRLFVLFAAPPERDLEWSNDGVEGGYRFLTRVWRLVTNNIGVLNRVQPYDFSVPVPKDLRAIHRLTHVTIRKVTADIGDRFHFNTAISSLMELVNALYQKREDLAGNNISLSVFREAVEALVLMLSPFAPHITEELWEMLGSESPLFRSAWPSYREESIATEEVTIVVQVNGKLRARIQMVCGSGRDEALKSALREDKVCEWVGSRAISKVIYVENKLINLVVH